MSPRCRAFGESFRGAGRTLDPQQSVLSSQTHAGNRSRAERGGGAEFWRVSLAVRFVTSGLGTPSPESTRRARSLPGNRMGLHGPDEPGARRAVRVFALPSRVFVARVAE